MKCNKTEFKKKTIIKLLMMLILLVLCVSPIVANAESGELMRDKYGTKDGEAYYYEYIKEPYYVDVKDEYAEKGYESVSEDINIVLDNSTCIFLEGEELLTQEIEGRQNVLLWEEDTTSLVDWTFEAPESGLYEIYVTYFPYEGASVDIERSIKIDDDYMFEEGKKISFTRFWNDKTLPIVNSIGDEIRPSQIEMKQWMVEDVKDYYGMNAEPMQYYIEEGSHTLRMEFLSQPMAIEKIEIKAVEQIKPYSEVYAEYQKAGYNEVETFIQLQAENNVLMKTSPTILTLVSEDPQSKPSAVDSKLINIIGGWSWRYGNDEVVWEITVPESGLYNLGFRVLQDNGQGLTTYRQIKIDGKIPFEEMREYSIPYNIHWSLETLADEEGNPYYYYLEEGTHTLSFSVKVGDYNDILNPLLDDARIVSSILQDIFMLAGNDPDIYYDYEFEENIPGLVESLTEISDRLGYYAERLIEMSARKPALATSLELNKAQIDEFLETPSKMAQRVADLKTTQESMAGIYTALLVQPLTIDFIDIGNENNEWYSGIRSNIFQRTYQTFSNLILSFSKDYDNISGIIDTTGEVEYNVIRCWMGRGTEWSQAIKNLADQGFTPESNTVISMNVIPQAVVGSSSSVILLSLVSGKAPDIALSLGQGDPVELAIREGVIELSQFDTDNSVYSRFVDNATIPFRYNDGIYAVPETISFKMMFYRKDIISELGIKLPDTWEELTHDVLPILYRNNMNFVYTPDISPFIYQNGGTFYNEAGTETMFDTNISYEAFKQWTELYINYGLPAVDFSLYAKIRTGESPLGIGNYALYLLLSNAAPEISGRWAVTQIPGTMQEDGTIDRTIGSGIFDTAAVMFRTCAEEDRQSAWDFIDWWTSTETQVAFAREIEAIIGVEARWNSANDEAFNSIAWDKDDLIQINQQWDWYRDIPVVLGSYYTGRYIVNAWTRVVLEDTLARDALEYAYKEINLEMRKKQEEYGIYVDEE